MNRADFITYVVSVILTGIIAAYLYHGGHHRVATWGAGLVMLFNTGLLILAKPR